MESKNSGLTILAGRIPIVKAYKQFAWCVNHIKRTEGPLPGADIVAKCITAWKQESGKTLLNKWQIAILGFEKPWCPDRFILMRSLPEKDDNTQATSFLIGSTAPNVNIVIEQEAATPLAHWRYYDALDKKILPQALQVLSNLFQEKHIQRLNVNEVAHRISVHYLQMFFKKQHIAIETACPAAPQPAPTIVHHRN